MTQRAATPGAQRHADAGALRAVALVVVLWLGLTAALLLVYEVLDRTVLANLPPSSRSSASVLRGIAISLTASIATAVYVLFEHVPSLRVMLAAAGEVDSSAGHSEANSQTDPRLALWLVWLRWVAIVALAGVVVAATTGPVYVADAAIVPLWSSLIALVAFNAALSLLPTSQLSSQRMLLLQVVFDALVIAFMVHHAGGLANPFASYFAFIAVHATIVLDGKRASRAIHGLALGVAALTVMEASELLPPLCTRDLAGVCLPMDRLHLLASGAAISVLVYGCPLFVLALVNSLRQQRAQLSVVHASVLEEREKLSSIIDCMADVVIFADRNGDIQLHNQAALALWPGGIEGGSSLHVCHTSSAWQRLLTKLSAPERLEIHPLLAVHGRSYEATYAPVRGAGGQLNGVVMIARDVTERLRQEHLRIRQERLATVGRLAASLAHEINNPLTSILLFTQHAQKQVDETSPLHAPLGTVRRNADACVNIVRDLLSYARQRDPERQSTDFVALIQDAVRTLSYRARSAGVEISVECDASGPVPALCDRDQLLQVILNLGLNAIEAMDAGGKLVLQLCTAQPAELRLRVRDTGPGIPAEQRDKIWDAFHTTKAEGTGLGLPVARNLIEAQGGRIELESELGVGATFSIVLPRSASAPEGQLFAHSALARDEEHPT